MKKIYLIFCLMILSSLSFVVAQETVINVTSTSLNDTYSTGERVDITVTFSDSVDVVGTPTLSLNTAPLRNATYLSGSGTANLIFRYTIQAEDFSTDLDYLNAAALVGTIYDKGTTNPATKTLVNPGDPTSLGANKNIVIDGVSPQVTLVKAVTANGIYNIGDITFEVTFNKVVRVTGTPRILLETGKYDRYALYQSGDNSAVLTFKYTIVSGDASSDLNYKNTNSFYLSGGPIKSVIGNNANLSLPASGSGNSLSEQSNIEIDAIAPTVSSVTSSTLNGFYTVGSPDLNIAVKFSENITVPGPDPILTLSGVVGGSVTYAGITGGNTLNFTYAIGVGDNSTDLNATLLTGTITDFPLGNSAILDLPGVGVYGSLGLSKNIVIDTGNPILSSVTSPSSTGNYSLGQIVYISVNFLEPVFVTSGVPTINLNTGHPASYFSGSGTNTLKFKYVVQSGDLVSALDYALTTSFIFNGASIADKAGNTITSLTLPATGGALFAKSLNIDGVVPTVTQVKGDNVVGSGADGTYKLGTGPIIINVTFSEPVTIIGSGIPKIQLETGATDKYATYSSGGGTSTLKFSYTIGSGDVSSNLNYKTASFNLSGCSIQDLNGNTVSSLPSLIDPASLGLQSAIVVDAKAPTVENITSSSPNGYYKVGSTDINITVKFSEDILVSVAPVLTLSGVAGGIVTYTGLTDGNTLNFSYQIGALDASSDLETASITGTITDVAGNAYDLTLPTPGTLGSLSRNKAIIIDTQTNTINAGIVVSSTNSGGLYTLGKTIFITVSLPQVVIVNAGGTPTAPTYPKLNVNTGNFASYYSGSGTSKLTFKYVVQAGDLINPFNYTTLDLNGATITDKAGNTATVTLPAPAGSALALKVLNIDGVVPGVDAVTATGPVLGVVDIIVSFNNNVNVDLTYGTPVIILETGPIDRYASYTSGTGTQDLVFQYTIDPKDITTDLQYKSTKSLYLRGGTIKSSNGNNANLTLPTPAPLGVSIDPKPYVKFVSSTTSNGTYGLGDKIYISVVFSENVAVVGAPTLKLETGTNDRLAAYYQAMSSGTTLVFEYTVMTGDASPDLDYFDANSLTAGTSIKDLGGNNAILTLPVPGASGSLSKYKAIVISTAKKSNPFVADNNSSSLSVNVYPIPSNGNFTVEYAGFNTSEVNVAVFDLLGRNVYSAKSSSVKESVSVSLNPGTYVLVVNNDTQKTTKRIVIE